MTQKPIHLSKSVSIPYDDRFFNTVLLGAAGSGKSQKVLLPMIQQDISENPYAGIVVFDADGGLSGPAAQAADKIGRPYLLWDPTKENCPFFNPMSGPEDAVLEELLAAFRDQMADLPPYIQTVSEMTLSNAIKVLKRLDLEEGVDGKYASLMNLDILLRNSGQKGRIMVQKFCQLNSKTADDAQKNAEIAAWFVNDYFAERSKLFDNCTCLRAQVAKLVENRYLKRVLNPDPEKGEHNEISFDDLMLQRTVGCFSVPQPKLGDLSRWLGTLLLLKYQHAAFSLSCSGTFYPDQFLYVDEFQAFVHPENSNLIIFGHAIRVGTTVALQSWSQIDRGGREYKQLRTVLMTNLRNTVLFSGLTKNDASYYADLLSVLSDKNEDEVAANILRLPEGYFIHSLLNHRQLQQYGVSKADLAEPKKFEREFEWKAVREANLAALKHDLCVAPEHEDCAVAKFQKFCADNGFDEYGLAHPCNLARLKGILSGEPAERMFKKPEGAEWDLLDNVPLNLMDHAPCLFRSSKTNRKCLVTQPYLPLYHLHDHDAKKTRTRWLKQLEDWATKDLGIKYKVLPDSSYYFSGTVLIAFYVDGDIVG